MAEMKVLRDIKELDGKIGVLTGLKTTNKTSLVGAVNENTEQINALKTKTSFTVTPKTGYTIVSNSSYTVNNVVYLRFKVAKTDGTVFSKSSLLNVASLPMSVGSDFPIEVLPIQTGVGYIACAKIAFASGADVYANVDTALATQLSIGGVILL